MDDTDRYREMLQKSLLTEGWENIFDYRNLKEWVQSNSERLRVIARNTLGIVESEWENYFANTVNNFSPSSNYDLPMTQELFRPFFDAVVESAKSMGLKPIREVELVTSTSISITPFARPTTDIHQLFIGPGSSTFLNYWAKAYTAIVRTIAAAGPSYQKINSPDDLKKSLSHNPIVLLLPARLSLYYAVTGTLIGFGEVVQPADYLDYRMQLLNAMKVFVLSHEYTHFLAHERELTLIDELGKESNEGLEFFCDAMGLQISREWGSKSLNWLAFTGVGAITFFRAVDTCETCLSLLTNNQKGTPSHCDGQGREQDAHPPINDRAMTLIDRVINTTHKEEKEQVESFLREYDLICTTVRDYVSEILNDSLAADRQSSDANS